MTRFARLEFVAGNALLCLGLLVLLPLLALVSFVDWATRPREERP